MFLLQKAALVLLFCLALDANAQTALTSADLVPDLIEVGTRGRFTVGPPFATFAAEDESVEIWLPVSESKRPVVVYAHGGAGYREDDRARVAMFRRNGYATISFDAYAMNGFSDWRFVTRRITNEGKQQMIWQVFKGAVAHALQGDRWDNRNVFFYGGSNGARVILHAGAQFDDARIRGIISEAPAATGFELGDYNIPTIIPFGKLDNWAGRSATDFVWTRTYASSPVSIQSWVVERQKQRRPIDFIFYENAGHLLFDGSLELVTVKRGNAVEFTAYKGAGEGVLQRYERDVIGFVERHTSSQGKQVNGHAIK